MNKEQFYNFINNPSLITNIKEEEIDEIIKEFPYFQSAYLLKAKLLAENKSIKFDNQIKISSLYALDRKLLYEYIHIKSDFNSVDKEKEPTIVEITKEDEKQTILKANHEKESEKKIVEKVEIEQKLEKKPEVKEKTVIAENSEKKETKLTEKALVIEPKKETKTELEEKKLTIKVDEKIVYSAENKKDKLSVTKEKTKESEEKTKEPLINKIKESKEAIKQKPIHESKKTIADEILEKLKDRKRDKSQESIADKILRKIKEKEETKTTKIEPTKKSILEEKTKSIEPDINKKTKKKLYFVKLRKFEIKQKDEAIKTEKPVKQEDFIAELDEIIEKPVQDFDFEEKKIVKEDKSNMCFSDWLNYVENREAKPKKPDEKNLIDKFIDENPSISIKAEVDNSKIPDYFSNQENDEDKYITETLANIYIKQGLFNKAISSLEKLSLKYPQKSIYFANRIKEVEKLIKD